MFRPRQTNLIEQLAKLSNMKVDWIDEPYWVWRTYDENGVSENDYSRKYRTENDALKWYNETGETLAEQMKRDLVLCDVLPSEGKYRYLVQWWEFINEDDQDWFEKLVPANSPEDAIELVQLYNRLARNITIKSQNYETT